MHVHLLYVNIIGMIASNHYLFHYFLWKYFFKLMPTLLGTQNYSTKQGQCAYGKFSKIN